MLELFRRILEDHDIALARDAAQSDLKKLIDYILKKLFKSAKENPLLLLEASLISIAGLPSLADRSAN